MPSLADMILTPEKRAAEREERARRFPGSIYQDGADVSPAMYQALVDALADGGEEAIQKALTAHPYLIQYAIKYSGHHGLWAYPKQVIRATSPNEPGLIPDFLVVTKNSLGYFWHIVELKKSSVQFANAKGDGLSPQGNLALSQCYRYQAHFRDYVDHVRGIMRIADLAQPQDVILLIGDSDLETDAQKQVRAQHQAEGKITIATYRRLLGAGLEDLGAFGRLPADALSNDGA